MKTQSQESTSVSCLQAIIEIFIFSTLAFAYAGIWICFFILTVGSIIYICASGELPTSGVFQIFFIGVHTSAIMSGLFFGVLFALVTPMTKIWTNSDGKFTYHRWTPQDYIPLSKGQKLFLLFGHPILFVLLISYCVVKNDYSIVKLLYKSMDEPGGMPP